MIRELNLFTVGDGQLLPIHLQRIPINSIRNFKKIFHEISYNHEIYTAVNRINRGKG